MNFAEVFIEVDSSWQYSSIGSDNGLAPARWQAIIWTNLKGQYIPKLNVAPWFIYSFWNIVLGHQLQGMIYYAFSEMCFILNFLGLFYWFKDDKILEDIS